MDKHVAELEELMHRLQEEHEQLLGLIRRKTDAMRRAQPELVSDCCRQEQQHIQRIGDLEKQRQQTVGRITGHLTPEASQPLRLREIADRLDEPQRGRLLVLQQKLRETMETVQRENSTARQATEGLLRHVNGVLQEVTGLLAGGGTYGRNGAIADRETAASSFAISG